MSYSKSQSHTKSLEELLNATPIVASKDSRKSAAPKAVNFLYPKFTPVGKDVTSNSFKSFLVEARKFDNKGKLVPLVTPAKSLQIPYTQATWKYSWSAMRHAHDDAMYNRLMNAGLSRYATPTTTMVRSNGTRRGLLNRMISQICVKYSLPRDKDIGYKMSQVLPFHPVPDEYFNLPMDGKHPAFSQINTKACAGLPYAYISMDNNTLPKVSDTTTLRIDYNSSAGYYYDDNGVKVPVKPGDPVPLGKPMLIVQHALVWARRILKVVDDAEATKYVGVKLNNFYEMYPDLGVFMLKRKDEKGERVHFPPNLDDEVQAKLAKVRPYGCQPLPTRMFGMYAGSYVEKYIKNFSEDPNSISAYHFSQFYGGAQRIFDYMDYHYNKTEATFWGLAYGDDQLWTIRLDDGEVLYLTPDVNAMDMNTRSDTIKAFYDWIRVVVPNIPELQKKCLIAHLGNAFIHRIHVDGSAIVEKTEALFSGISLTTIINIANSARIQIIVKDEYENYKKKNKKLGVGEAIKVLVSAFAKVKASLGYTFKGLDELEAIEKRSGYEAVLDGYKGQFHYAKFADKEVEGIPLPFLSNKIVIYNKKPICAPYEPFKFGASLVLPSSFGQKGLGTRISQNERCFGVYFSGGWMDTHLTKVLAETISENNKVLGNQKAGVSELNSSIEMDVLEVMDKLDFRELPSVEFMADMNQLSKEEFVTKYLGKPADTDPKVDKSKDEVLEVATSSYDVIREMLEDDEEDIDIGDLKMTPIDKAKMGNYNALNKQEEKDKEHRRVLKKLEKKTHEFVQKHVKPEKVDYFANKIGKDDFDIDQFMEEVAQELDPYDDSAESAQEELSDEIRSEMSRWESWQEEHGLREEQDKPLEDVYEVPEEEGYDEDEDLPPPVPEWRGYSNYDKFEFGVGRGGFNE